MPLRGALRTGRRYRQKHDERIHDDEESALRGRWSAPNARLGFFVGNFGTGTGFCERLDAAIFGDCRVIREFGLGGQVISQKRDRSVLWRRVDYAMSVGRVGCRWPSRSPIWSSQGLPSRLVPRTPAPRPRNDSSRSEFAAEPPPMGRPPAGVRRRLHWHWVLWCRRPHLLRNSPAILLHQQIAAARSLGALERAPGGAQRSYVRAGSMLWFMQKRLPGSYFALILASRL